MLRSLLGLGKASRPRDNSCGFLHGARSIATEQPNEADKAPTAAEEELRSFLDRIQSDAYIRMLASPLRRCSATQVVLPRELMFRVISHRADQDQGLGSLKQFGLEEEEIQSRMARRDDERNALLRRRSRRWVFKEEKKSVLKALLRAQRMALHKTTTSQTSESRDRFSKQLSDIKEKIAQYKKPPSKGLLLPFGLTKESERSATGVARGRGVWCTLNKNVVTAMFKTNIHKTFESTLPLSKDVPSLVQEGLETRVVEEAQILLQKLTGSPSEESCKNGWLIRRMRGPEVRGVLERGQIELWDVQESSTLACLVVSGGSVRLAQEENQLPVYELDKIILEERRCIQLKEAMRQIAEVVARKQRRLRKGSSTGGNRVAADKALKGEAAERLRLSHEKWPRLHAMKRDERTVPLCIALWRLHTWTAPD